MEEQLKQHASLSDSVRGRARIPVKKVPLHAHKEPRTAEEAERNGDDAEDTGAAFQRREGEIQESVRRGEDTLLLLISLKS